MSKWFDICKILLYNYRTKNDMVNFNNVSFKNPKRTNNKLDLKSSALITTHTYYSPEPKAIHMQSVMMPSIFSPKQPWSPKFVNK